ncbi:MAG: hypothetical protein EB059_02250 [Alphaproteobacteria bacterium]|nr:hypothetical protein [Alphaproteobacteria bacterium]
MMYVKKFFDGRNALTPLPSGGTGGGSAQTITLGFLIRPSPNLPRRGRNSTALFQENCYD